MKNYILLIIMILAFFVGCSTNEIDPLPQDYNF